MLFAYDNPTDKTPLYDIVQFWKERYPKMCEATII